VHFTINTEGQAAVHRLRMNLGLRLTFICNKKNVASKVCIILATYADSHHKHFDA